MNNAESVHSFWIGDAAHDPVAAGAKTKLWFLSSKQADDDIKERFGHLLQQAENGQLDDWISGPGTALALIILLDQFSRNLYRGTARAFSNDPAALDIAEKLVDSGQHLTLKPIERVFLYLPFEHSESIESQARSVLLFQSLTNEAEEIWQPQLQSFTDHAIEHQTIILKFGRFPHRNKVLDRVNTAAEEVYLQDAKTFGQ